MRTTNKKKSLKFLDKSTIQEQSFMNLQDLGNSEFINSRQIMFP